MYLMPSIPQNPIHLPSGEGMESEEANLVIRRRMRELGITQKELGKRVNKSQAWVSQELLSDVQQTIKRLWVNEPYNLSALARALEWSDYELIEKAGVAIPVQQPQVLTSSDQAFLDRYGDRADLSVLIPVYGSLAAGIKGFEEATEPEDYRPFDPRELPKGVDPAKLYLVKANGNSMYQEGMARPIPDGAWLLIEARALPNQGDVVVAYIPELNLGVVKQYQRDNENALLRSYRVGGKTFWASEYPDMQIQGIVRRVTYEL